MSLPLFAEATKHELTHPVSNEPTGLVLEILPADHDDVYEAGISVLKALRTKGAQEAMSVAASLEHRITVATASIIGWEVKSDQWVEVIKKLKFDDATFTKEKVQALLSMRNAAWIRAQVERVLADKESFFKVASPN